MELQLTYQRDVTKLWLGAWAGQRDEKPESAVAPEADDRRFSAAAWDDPYYDFIKQNYLLYERFVMASVETLPVEERERVKMRFHARQFVHALSPANFLATNPVAIKAAVESNGETLTRGMSNLLQDVQRGRISTNDETAFAVGRNLAVTPGSVIYENELMQLIQYAPSTEQVHQRPLIIIPPCINKFYILDLSPKNSFVRWAVEQGNTVFLVSWRNIDAATAHLTWDDYIGKGVMRALDIACKIRKVDQVNALGFCVGGTMLAAALATLAKQGRAPAATATFLATMLDFSDTGELGHFVDEDLVRHFETTIGQGGIRSGRDLASTFYALRENDLIWPYVTNNYLLGKTPPAFDILYWNGDATNLPGPWYCWYLRNTYLENKLREPNAVHVCGEPLDLSLIDIPTYMVGTREDHIVPWTTAYRSNEFLSSPRRFVLGASGHIAGIINPPSANKRSFWTNEQLPPTADEWFAGAKEQSGSWWADWHTWLEPHTGAMVEAPKFPGNAEYAPLEDAPGRYVKAAPE
ncbi:MAG TPA: class I poly(R)-hydroxyalkanoic acid synthase [Burkholderiales bacterium]|nr:class I poly(R)-hydroxyalkanoic acid synthase [Burkholderiales bacterium]